MVWARRKGHTVAFQGPNRLAQGEANNPAERAGIRLKKKMAH